MCMCESVSTWSGVPQGPPDPIFSVNEAYNVDPCVDKINLVIGAYRDDKGCPYVLDCVKEAEARIASVYPDHEYANIYGLVEFNHGTLLLAYSDDDSMRGMRPENVVCQSVSGTGALRVGGEFVFKFVGKEIYLPRPTWGNHPKIFGACMLQVREYRYCDGPFLDISGLLEDLSNASDGAVVLLHACAHNPTGVDPGEDDWYRILDVFKRKKHIAFFDMAYQGFATGDLVADGWAVRLWAESGMPMLLAQSFSKNMGLYGERVGAISIPCESKTEANKVLSQLKCIARAMYSNPPIHGARIVSLVLRDEELRRIWKKELLTMNSRISGMRHQLRELLEKGTGKSWVHITSQKGMFCYSGLTGEQVGRLISEFHVYLTSDGRISMAGVNSSNIERLAYAIVRVVSA